MISLSKMPSTYPSDYDSARKLFREQCCAMALSIESHVCSQIGPAGEELTTDIVKIGADDASKIIFVVSGTHGLEGLAGSLCQTSWLKSPPVLPNDTAVVMVHIINPWGCAWRRR